MVAPPTGAALEGLVRLPWQTHVLSLAVVLAVCVAVFVLWRAAARYRHAVAVRSALAKNKEAWAKLDTQLVWVVGCSGAGKSTTAEMLSTCLGSAFHDLDDLFWLPNWVRRSGSEVKALLRPLLAAGPVVLAGNYAPQMGKFMAAKATTVVWVRPSLALIMWQLVTRSLVRLLLRQKSCAGNQESVRQLFFSKESVIYKTYRAYERVEARYTELAKNPPPRLEGGVVQLRSRAEADAFHAFLSQQREGAGCRSRRAKLATMV